MNQGNYASFITYDEHAMYAAGYDAGEQDAMAEAAEWREVAHGALEAATLWRRIAVVTFLTALVLLVGAAS